jgi:putative oxidoreductase
MLTAHGRLARESVGSKGRPRRLHDLRPSRQTLFKEHTMLKKLFHTEDDRVLTILRLVLGVVFLAHGAQKMLGWFGGYGFKGTMGFFTQTMHIPTVFAFLAICAEFFGGLGLLLGLLSRIAAFGIAVNMLVAIFMVHLPNGFFMNWSGQQKGEGFEYHLLVVALTLVVMIRGAGDFSLDRAISALVDGEPASAGQPGGSHSPSRA